LEVCGWKLINGLRLGGGGVGIANFVGWRFVGVRDFFSAGSCWLFEIGVLVVGLSARVTGYVVFECVLARWGWSGSGF